MSPAYALQNPVCSPCDETMNLVADVSRLLGLAAELVRLNTDILFAPTSSAVLAASKATDSIPIIFALVTDPVGERFVASLSRPSGTITGMTSIAVDLAAKRLEILLEVAGQTSRFGILYYSAHPGVPLQLDELQRAANVLGKSYLAVQAGRFDDLPMAFETMVRWGADAAAVIENPFYFANRERKVPASCMPSLFYRLCVLGAEAGGAMGTGVALGSRAAGSLSSRGA